MIRNDTICAISTPPGNGAIALIRLSGDDSFSICQKIVSFSKRKKQLANQKNATIHYAKIIDTENKVIDEVLIYNYKKPHSYTGENMVEITCHGSVYIQKKIMELLVKNGSRLAEPGEFTLRAFINGKMDLSQAEAVADLIASQSKAAHDIAIQQMRGEFSKKIADLRQQLLHFISLIELELDFSEENVEFADRQQLSKIIDEILEMTNYLIRSFELGNVLKNGISVAIVGKPNVGKSTLLNVLLNEEKAIVSDIPGTTRDTIEDIININGFTFRFIDTAGIRHTTDAIETMGVERTFQSIRKASIVLLMVDANDTQDNIVKQIKGIELQSNQNIALVVNKIDRFPKNAKELKQQLKNNKLVHKILYISALQRTNLVGITNYLLHTLDEKHYNENDVVISNVRHYEALTAAAEAGNRVATGLCMHITSDLLAQDIRQMLHYMGIITGEITTDEILGNIFKNFCIGK
jgi:tRNA modification GTPase